MTKQEALKILTLIETVYSSCLMKNQTVLRWLYMCSEMDYDKVFELVLNHLKQSPYPPTMEEIMGDPKKRSEKLNKTKWMQEYSIKAVHDHNSK